ncbi:MAG: NAD(P)-dependent oxidoreductase [Finegoldia magna]|nr:NAD(P)-dependent oxidoreductase [Finegoldia magna]
MNKMQRKLVDLDNHGQKVRVGLVGCGKMGSGLVSQLSRIKGMRPSVIIDRHVDKCVTALRKAGVKDVDIIKTTDLKVAENAVKNNSFVVSDDYTLSYKLDMIDGVIDATGNPPFGTQLAVESIEHEKHTILLNVECDAVVGPILNEMAKKKGVVYTGSAGDEPGAIIQLSDFALGLGFKLLAVGKGKNNPLDNYTNEDILREEALSKGLVPKMLTSFVDGTNTMIELTAVANALGFTPDVLGCHGITTNIHDIADEFKLKEQGGILNNYNIVDFAFGVAPGVFAIVEKEPTIYPKYGQVSDTITVAKRDIKKGQRIEGIGGHDCFGKITSHKHQMENNLLPMPIITEKTTAKVDIAKDTLITYDMVNLDEDHIITKLRKRQDELGL